MKYNDYPGFSQTNIRDLILDSEIKGDISGVYCFINTINSKYYIGSSISIRKRRNGHFLNLRKNNHHCRYFQSDFNRYGEENFEIHILEITDKLLEREQYFLDLLRSKQMYNIFESAYAVYGEKHPMFGKTHSKEAREKIKVARSKQVISHSKETREKISKGNIGKIISKKSIERMRKTKIESGRPSWNKGLTAKNTESIRKAALHLSKKLNNNLVISEYNNGLSINEIAQNLNCAWNCIKRVLLSNNIKTRSISEQKMFSNKRIIRSNDESTT